jgi:hypothetical protein
MVGFLIVTTETNVKKQIYKIIEAFPVEQLPVLLQTLKQLKQGHAVENAKDVAPNYELYHKALDTNIIDLAAQSDQPLYASDASGEVPTPLEWAVWQAQCDAVAQRILAYHKGQVPDFDMIWQLSKNDLERRHD